MPLGIPNLQLIAQCRYIGRSLCGKGIGKGNDSEISAVQVRICLQLGDHRIDEVHQSAAAVVTCCIGGTVIAAAVPCGAVILTEAEIIGIGIGQHCFLHTGNRISKSGISTTHIVGNTIGQTRCKASFAAYTGGNSIAVLTFCLVNKECIKVVNTAVKILDLNATAEIIIICKQCVIILGQNGKGLVGQAVLIVACLSGQIAADSKISRVGQLSHTEIQADAGRTGGHICCVEFIAQAAEEIRCAVGYSTGAVAIDIDVCAVTGNRVGFCSNIGVNCIGTQQDAASVADVVRQGIHAIASGNSLQLAFQQIGSFQIAFVGCDDSVGDYHGFNANHKVSGHRLTRHGVNAVNRSVSNIVYGNCFQRHIGIGRNAEGIILSCGCLVFAIQSAAIAVNQLYGILLSLAHRFDLYQQVCKGGRICHHREGFLSIEGSQIYFKCVRAVYEAIGTDTNFTVAPVILTVPNLGTAQIAGQSNLQSGVTVSDQILGCSKTELVVAGSTPPDSLCIHIGNSQTAIPLVAVTDPIQHLKAGCTGLIQLETEYLIVGRYIVIPGPAAVYITAYGVHRAAPAPNHGTGVLALGNVICVHEQGALTGIVFHQVLFQPSSGRDHIEIIATSLQHIVAVLNGKVGVGAALCPVQGFCTLISTGTRYSHRACIEDQIVPGIAIVELIQVNTNVHICSRIQTGPITTPCAAVGIVGIVVGCGLGIDGKYQVGIALVPQLLHSSAGELAVGTGGQTAIFIDGGSSCPTGSAQHYILRSK